MTVAELPAATGGAVVPRRRGLARGVLSQPVGAVAIGYLVLLVASTILAPLIAPYSPLLQNLDVVLQGPTKAHLLGTDAVGRDLLSRLIFGARISLIGVAEALAVYLILGVPVGLLAGYLGGWADAIVSRTVDVMLAIPGIITLLVVLSVFSENQTAAMIAFGVLGAPGLARVVRSAVLAVRKELFITAAWVSGLTTFQIMRRHLLPAVAGPVIVRGSLFSGAALLVQSGLAFLGLGVHQPDPSWGGMIAEASLQVERDAWMLIPPGIAIGLTVMALGLVGDAVRDSVGGRAQRRAGGGRIPPPASTAPAGSEPAAAPERRQSSKTPILTVRDLSVAFPAGSGWSEVVQRVNFDIGAGEIVGLVGESGCGKSVTARAIMGLLSNRGRVTGGSCLFEGKELVGMTRPQWDEVRGSRIALISQEPAVSLDPNYRVGSQLAQVARRHRAMSHGRAKRFAVDLLEQVRMPDPERVARLYPYELSGGMAQRVCIAAALAGDPTLLVADEPTTALDVTVQEEILNLLYQIQRERGLSILLITHDLGVVADSCDRAMVMYAGQIVESSEIRQLFRRPLHPYTRALLDSDPHSVKPGARLSAIAGTVPPPNEWPAGCHFAPRCSYATDACTARPIALVAPHDGRLTRCIHHDRVEARSGG